MDELYRNEIAWKIHMWKIEDEGILPPLFPDPKRQKCWQCGRYTRAYDKVREKLMPCSYCGRSAGDPLIRKGVLVMPSDIIDSAEQLQRKNLRNRRKQADKAIEDSQICETVIYPKRKLPSMKKRVEKLRKEYVKERKKAAKK